MSVLQHAACLCHTTLSDKYEWLDVITFYFLVSHTSCKQPETVCSLNMHLQANRLRVAHKLSVQVLQLGKESWVAEPARLPMQNNNFTHSISVSSAISRNFSVISLKLSIRNPWNFSGCRLKSPSFTGIEETRVDFFFSIILVKNSRNRCKLKVRLESNVKVIWIQSMFLHGSSLRLCHSRAETYATDRDAKCVTPFAFTDRWHTAALPNVTIS